MEMGDILEGRYIIEEVIGRGGMSVVYKAIDTNIRAEVAVKEVSGKKNPNRINNARIEAEMMRRMNDIAGVPNIRDVLYDNNENPTVIYVVMDYINGKTLQEHIGEPPDEVPFPETDVIKFGIQLGRVLVALHGLNPPIIYRDMKPGNIIWRESDNTIHLIDFGIAKELKDNNVHDERATGTKVFMPREQLSPEHGGRQESDQRSDIYSVGATLFYLVTGKFPEVSNTTHKHYSILDLNNDLSPQFANVVAKCLEIVPDNRYQNASELLRAIQNVEPEYRKHVEELERKKKNFLLLLSTTVIFAVSGGILSVVNAVQTNNSYDNYYKNAENTSSDIKDRISNAVSAINTSPNELKTYNLLLDLFEWDDAFTVDEEKILNEVVDKRLSDIDKFDGYSEFAYNVGSLYWRCYEYGDSDIIKRTKSMSWFESVDESSQYYEDAQIYYEICNFVTNIDTWRDKGKSAGHYNEYWKNLVKMLDSAEKSSEPKLKAESCSVMCSAILTYAQSFKNDGDGVSKEEMQEQLDKVLEIVDSDLSKSAATEPKIAELIQKIYTSCDAAKKEVKKVYYPD